MSPPMPFPRTRRAAFAAAACLLALSAGLAGLAAPPGSAGNPAAATACAEPLPRHTLEPGAGAWQTWFVDPADVPVPPPPGHRATQEELRQLRALQASRTPAQVAAALAWVEGPAGAPWSEAYLGLVAQEAGAHGSNPPRIAREIALLETALSDAFVAAWDAKYCWHRPAPSHASGSIQPAGPVLPSPSYPSEHAAAAGVASVLFPVFFPGEDPGALDALAEQARDAPVLLGLHYPSDAAAGYALGRAVARAVLDARADDGSGTPWDGTGRLTGPCNWEPTPPAFAPPLEPAWGGVQPFLMATGSEFRPPPPPACDGDDYLAQHRDLYEASLDLDARQAGIADYWEAPPGSVTPPGMNLQIALDHVRLHGLGTLRAQRVLAHAGAALADAGIGAWDAKFAYWGDRPVLALRRLGWDAGWEPHSTTPPFPGYVSGHATFTGAGQEVLKHFFPEHARQFSAYQTEAAMARYYGGIHVRADNEQGIALGQRIGQLAIARALADGAG